MSKGFATLLRAFKPHIDRERNDLRAAAHAQEGEQELLLRELASTEHRLRSLQARDVTCMLGPRTHCLTSYLLASGRAHDVTTLRYDLASL